MKALVFGNGAAALANLKKPVAGVGLALIKVKMAGICGTDLELLDGYYDFSGVPGHEFVGVVEESPGRPDLIGRRVTAEINIGCGGCPDCLAGDERQCPSRRTIGISGWDGALAEFLVAPVSNLEFPHDSVSDEEAVFTEPLAAALRIAEQVHLAPGMKAAVLGDGKLGLPAALALRIFLPELTLVGRHGKRLEIAEKQGVKTALLDRNVTESEAAARLGRFDLVVEATGNPGGIGYALALVRPRGTIVAKTTIRQPASMSLTDVAVREIRIIGSRCGRFGLALDFLKNKRLDVRPLIEAEYSLDRYQDALARARQTGAGKVLIRM